MIGLRVTKHNRMKHREKQVLNRPASVYPDRIHARRSSYRGSISYLRQKARAQKVRKMGLSELSASFQYMNFALLMRRNYVKNQFQNEIFHRGKKSGLMHVVARGGGGKRALFCRRMAVKAFHAHTHNMQESQDNAADSASLMKITGWTVPSLFSL